MLTYYYDVKDENELPKGSKFVDPYDKQVFYVKDKESLPNFIKRIQQSRDQLGHRKILDKDLRQLVIDSLVISSSRAIMKKYFMQKTAFPTMQSLLSFITTLAYSLINSNNVSVKDQERRLSDCFNGCSFHKSSKVSGLSELTKNLVNKVVNSVSGMQLDKTKYELANMPLGSCGMCGGCQLSNKKHLSAQSVLAGLHPESIERILRVYGSSSFGRCWQLREALENPKLKQILISKLQNCNIDAVELLKEYEEEIKTSGGI